MPKWIWITFVHLQAADAAPSEHKAKGKSAANTKAAPAAKTKAAPAKARHFLIQIQKQRGAIQER